MAVPDDEDGYYWDGQQWQPVDATPVDVAYQVMAMTQPTTHASWATAFAILVNYRDSSDLAAEDIGDAVGVDLDSVASWSDVSDAASHFRLLQSDSAGLDVQGWARLLADNGPLWICVHAGNHAVVLCGVRGDGTPDGTTFSIVDPWYGSTTTDLDGLPALFETVNTQAPGDALIVWHR